MQKILVINLMHVGDLLLVTPVLRTLRTRYPKAHIALLADAKLADLVRNNQNIDELITLDKKGRDNNLAAYANFIGKIRAMAFDTVINLHRNERASFIAAFSGARQIVGYATWGAEWFFHKVIPNRKEIKHQVEAHFDVLREALDIQEMDDRGIEMWLDDGAVEKAEELWREAFPAEDGVAQFPVIGLNVGASWPTKRWRPEYFAELADKLLEQGYGIAMLGGNMDWEAVNGVKEHMQHRDHPRMAFFTGKLTLMELGAVLKKCTLLVTNDSGPMHVAVAMDVPLVSMFGSSPVVGFAPYNEKSVVLAAPVECHPCYKHQCPLGTHACMWKITVADVMGHVEEILRKR